MYLSPSIRRTLTLVLATFLGLVCGTVYLYSSYSPQFAAVLGYTVLNLSTIAMVGTVGSALAGPFAGIVVDAYGYTPSLLAGGLLIVTGYTGMKVQFDGQSPNVAFSCFLYFMVGAGSTFINLASLKCVAVTFPSMKGVATSLPLLMYGLSALMFSFLGSVLAPGDTSRFLGLLAVVTGGLFAVFAPLVMMCDRREEDSACEEKPELNAFASSTSLHTASQVSSRASSRRRYGTGSMELTGFALLRTVEFWGLFATLGVFAGLGQMYIFSVGFIVSALTGGHHLLLLNPNAPILVQREQQYQVAVLSVANCAGRLASGALGDLITRKFHKPRMVLILVPALGYVGAQAMGATLTLPYLWIQSALTGVLYGFTYCVFPLTVADTFGIANYSLNWGIVGLAPIIPAYAYNGYFGFVYDQYVLEEEIRGVVLRACDLGRECYRAVFISNLWSALGALCVALVLVVKALRALGAPAKVREEAYG